MSTPDQQHPTQPQPSAGWYPDPAGGGGLRWWDGLQWTQHLSAPANAAPSHSAPANAAPSYSAPANAAPSYTTPSNAAPSNAAPSYAASNAAPSYAAQSYAPWYGAQAAPPRKLPESTPVDTPFFWAIVLLPLLTVVVLLFWDVESYGRTLLVTPNLDGYNPFQSILNTGYLALMGIGWATTAATIVLAYFDWRTLTLRGMDKPFHWAWSFLALMNGGMLVYVIGRSVVVRRRSGRGLTPLWVFIGVEVVTIVVAVVKVTALISAVFTGIQWYDYPTPSV